MAIETIIGLTPLADGTITSAQEDTMQDMQDEADRAEADRIHEGYQQRYQKERRASYMLALFGLLAFVAVAVVMFMHRYMNTNPSNIINIEPAAGSNMQIEPPAPRATPIQNPTL